MATITPSVLFPVLESLPSQLASAITSRGPGRQVSHRVSPRLINRTTVDCLSLYLPHMVPSLALSSANPVVFPDLRVIIPRFFLLQPV